MATAPALFAPVTILCDFSAPNASLRIKIRQGVDYNWRHDCDFTAHQSGGSWPFICSRLYFSKEAAELGCIKEIAKSVEHHLLFRKKELKNSEQELLDAEPGMALIRGRPFRELTTDQRGKEDWYKRQKAYHSDQLKYIAALKQLQAWYTPFLTPQSELF